MSKLPTEIANFFLAMQSGPPGMEMLKAMFAEDAEYTEPFSGQNVPHVGPEAIATAFSRSRSDTFDDTVLNLGAVTVSGEAISVQWTCISQAIPGGRGSGTNLFRLSEGKIVSLTTTIDESGA